MIPMVFHTLSRIQWALLGAKPLECGSLLPLCFHAQTPCLSPYRVFPISRMTGHATRFDPANRATEHAPAGGGQECPRSCTRWKRQRRSGARPSSAAPIRWPIVHLFQSGKSVARSLTGWGRARMPALLHALEKATAVGSAAVLDRINPMADRAPVSVRQIRRPIFDRLGAGKNARAPKTRWTKQRRSGARPSSGASIRWPIVHLFQSGKSVARSLTGWGRARMPALLHALEKATALGARPFSTAST